MEDQPTYVFKHINIDLKSYLESMRFRADLKRAEARTLTREADVIDEERHRLEADLVEKESPDAA